MNQRDLDRAVARATGETVERIHRIGFNLLIMPVVRRADHDTSGKLNGDSRPFIPLTHPGRKRGRP